MEVKQFTNKLTGQVSYCVVSSNFQQVYSVHPTLRKAQNKLKTLQSNPQMLSLAEFYANGAVGSILRDYASGNYSVINC